MGDLSYRSPIAIGRILAKHMSVLPDFHEFCEVILITLGDVYEFKKEGSCLDLDSRSPVVAEGQL